MAHKEQVADIIGQKCGEWTVLERDYEKQTLTKKHPIYYNCVCSCGVKRSVLRDSLISGKSKSCGCLKTEATKRIDNLIGHKYGRLLVVAQADDKIQSDGKHRIMWKCICDCGNTKIVGGSDLKSGNTTSCGCFKKELFSKRYKGVSRPDMVGKNIIPLLEIEQKLCEINPYVKIIGEYKGITRHCDVECVKCGHIWSPALHTLIKGHGCPVCSKSSSSFMENFIFVSLSSVMGEDNVKHRDRKTIGKELDIYLPQYKYAVEIGSWYWHQDKVENDLLKYDLCKKNNIRLRVIYDSFIGDEKPFKECEIYKENLGQEDTHIILREIVLSVFEDLGLEIDVESIDWKSIANIAHFMSARMTTADFVEKLAIIVPNIEVLGEYKGFKHLIEVRCRECGYKYSARCSSLFKGHGCRKCGRKLVAKKLSYSHNVFVSKLKEINPNVIVDDIYVNSKSKIKIHCDECGYVWSATPASLLSGKGCSRCYHRRSAITRATSYSDFIKEFEEKGNPHIKIVGEYKAKSKKIEVMCNRCCKHWFATGRDLCNGHGCNYCDGNAQLNHEEFIRRLSLSNSNITALGTYSRADEKILVKCNICGYEWTPRAIALIKTNPNGCPHCANHKTSERCRFSHDMYVERLAEVNTDVEVIHLYKTMNDKILHRCKLCGNEWMISPSRMLNGKAVCQICSSRINKSQKNKNT